jgi:hypothetical protein
MFFIFLSKQRFYLFLKRRENTHTHIKVFTFNARQKIFQTPILQKKL